MLLKLGKPNLPKGFAFRNKKDEIAYTIIIGNSFIIGCCRGNSNKYNAKLYGLKLLFAPKTKIFVCPLLNVSFIILYIVFKKGNTV